MGTKEICVGAISIPPRDTLAFTAPIRNGAGSDFIGQRSAGTGKGALLKLEWPSAKLQIQAESAIRAQIRRNIRLQGSIPGEHIAERQRRGRNVQLRMKTMRPIQFAGPLNVRRRHFQKQFPNFRVSLAEPPVHFHGKIGRGIRVTLGEPPAVHPGQSRRCGNGPLRCAGIRAASRRGFRGADARIEIDRKQAAHSVVILPDKTQRIRKRCGAPGQIKLGRLKTRGRSGNRTAQAQRPDILQLHTRAHRPRFQIELPAARAILLDAARNVDKREGTFVVPLLEINAPAVHVDPVRARRTCIARRRHRANKSGARAGRRSGRQPALDIPVTFGVARQIQTGTRKRDGTELEAAGEQGPPSQARCERVRAQEVFVAEMRIIRNADEMGLDPRAVEQTEIEPGNVDGAAKARGEVRDQVAARGTRPQEA